MKPFLLTIAAIILVSAAVHAQQPTSAQTRQTAQEFLTRSQATLVELEEILANLKSSNTSNFDAGTFNRLRAEITRIENSIIAEETMIKDVLDRGNRVNPEAINRVERLVTQHRMKINELELFVSRAGR